MGANCAAEEDVFRPGWQVDLKWILGVTFVLCAAVAGFSYSAYRFTSPGPARGATAAVIQAMTKRALDDELFAAMQQAAQSQPEAEVYADGVTIPLLGKEMTGLSKNEALEKAAVRLADILYYDGVAAGEAYFQDLTPGEDAPSSGQGPAKEDEGLQLEILGLFTKESNDAVRPFALVSPLVAAVLLAGTAFFSRGFGRLGSPGIALAVAVTPFALATALLRSALTTGQGSSEAAIAGLAAALYPAVDSLYGVFTVMLVTGAVAAAVALAGNIALALARPSNDGAATGPPPALGPLAVVTEDEAREGAGAEAAPAEGESGSTADPESRPLPTSTASHALRD